MYDIWEDFLSASVSDEGVILDIRAHACLGEVPDDWFDEDGELLAEHTDDQGDLRMPETMRDRPVISYQNGNFFGELQSLHDRPVVLPVLSEPEVQEALDKVGWDASDTSEVYAALQELVAKPT